MNGIKRKTAHKRPGRPMVRETLREVRERRAPSLSDLAELAGVNRVSIHRMERGATIPCSSGSKSRWATTRPDGPTA